MPEPARKMQSIDLSSVWPLLYAGSMPRRAMHEGVSVKRKLRRVSVQSVRAEQHEKRRV